MLLTQEHEVVVRLRPESPETPHRFSTRHLNEMIAWCDDAPSLWSYQNRSFNEQGGLAYGLFSFEDADTAFHFKMRWG